jgi:hypothetical protein
MAHHLQDCKSGPAHFLLPIYNSRMTAKTATNVAPKSKTKFVGKGERAGDWG